MTSYFPTKSSFGRRTRGRKRHAKRHCIREREGIACLLLSCKQAPIGNQCVLREGGGGGRGGGGEEGRRRRCLLLVSIRRLPASIRAPTPPLLDS